MTVLADAVVAAFRERFPDRAFLQGGPNGEILTVPAAHPAVGPVIVTDDDDEATVFLGDITHFHVNPYDASLSAQGRASWIAESVTSFLESLFADRVLMWSALFGGGSKTVDTTPTEPPDGWRRWFLWSGPLEHRGKEAG